jgi:hypothetical protein
MNSTPFLLLANSNPEVNENQEMDMTIESLNFPVGSSGSTRLFGSRKTGSIGKRNQDNHNDWIIGGLFQRGKLASQLHNSRKYRRKIKELEETIENLDIGGTVDKSYTSQKDFITQSGDVSSNIHQLCVIITEAAEENDHADNAATHAQVNKSRRNNKKEKEKIHVSTGE